MSEIQGSPSRRYRDSPYSALWFIPAVLSVNLTVPAIRDILQKIGLKHLIALGIALVLSLGLSFAIGSLERVEKRSHRIAIILAVSACCAGLWYWSR
jgi:predicted exporter